MKLDALKAVITINKREYVNESKLRWKKTMTGVLTNDKET